MGFSTELGGALQVSGGVVTVNRTTFVGCNATRSGAVYVSSGEAVFSDCTFEGCSAHEEEGGGAMWVEGDGSVALRNHTHLYNNYAADTLDSIHTANRNGGFDWSSPPGSTTPLALRDNGVGNEHMRQLFKTFRRRARGVETSSCIIHAGVLLQHNVAWLLDIPGSELKGCE